MIIRIKKKDEPYVVLRKHFINDKKLSCKAKGIMTYLLSKPDGWHVQVGDIVNNCADGEKAIRSGIRELKEHKYMVPTIDRDPATGKILKYDYDVHELPVAQNRQMVTESKSPLAGLRQVGKRQVENRHVNKELLKQNNKLSKYKGEDNNNNKSIKQGNPKNIIITTPIKHKRKFNKIKNTIMEIGWVGPLDEIVQLHNNDPDYVHGWVQRIEEINNKTPGNWAGLLRKSLRSGERVPTREEIEARNRRAYLEDPYSEYVEDPA